MIRVTLNATEVIDPDNWRVIRPNISIHEVYGTLFDVYTEQRLVFYKDGKTLIDDYYATHGPTGKISVTIEEAVNGSWVVIAEGNLSLAPGNCKIRRNFTEAQFEPVSFETKFLNRDEIKTSLQSLVDMDGDAITTFSDETIDLTIDNQILKLRRGFIFNEILSIDIDQGDYSSSDTISWGIKFPISSSKGALTIEEGSSRKRTSPADPEQYVINTQPGTSFVFSETGECVLEIDVKIQVSATNNVDGTGINTTSKLMYQLNDDTPVEIDSVVLNAASSVLVDELVYNDEVDLSLVNKGDTFRLYVDQVLPNDNLDIGITLGIDSSSAVYESTVNAIQDTEFEDTTCKGMLVYEYLLRLIQKSTGQNDCLRSDFFGRTDGEVWQADSDGEGSLYFISNVYQLRGYPLSGYGLKDALRDAFKELNKIWPLGLAIEDDGSGGKLIRIEPLSYFKNKESEYTFTTTKKGIEWESYSDYIFGSVKTGYRNFEEKDTGTLNGTHSPRTYAVVGLSDAVKKTLEIELEWIGSGELIELLRRKRYNANATKDEEFNKLPIIINVERDGSDYVRVKDDAYSAITGLNNSSTQSNLEITPARNVLRHAEIILSGLKNKIDSEDSFDKFLRFESGTGNTNVSTTKTEESQIDEDGDLSISQIEDFGGVIFNAGYQGTCTTVITGEQRRNIKEKNQSIVLIDGVEEYECLPISITVKDISTNETELIVVRKE